MPEIHKFSNAPFPWKILLGSFLLLASGHILAVTLNHATWVALHLQALWITGLAAFVMCWGAIRLHRLRFASHLPLPYLLPTVLALDWLALDLHKSIEEVPWWVVSVVCILVFALAAAKTHAVQHQLETARAIEQQPTRTFLDGASLQSSPTRQFLTTDTEDFPRSAIRGLILIVSRINSNQKLETKNNMLPSMGSPSPRWQLTLGTGAQLNLDGTSLRKDINDLQDAIERKLPSWNWQQLLRAVEPHVENLRTGHIWLVGSPDNPEILNQVPEYIGLARDFLKGYLPETQFHLVHGVDLEDFDALLTALRNGVLKPAHEEFSLPYQALALDVTGGQKIASIAGAVLTLNLQVACQYVPTHRLVRDSIKSSHNAPAKPVSSRSPTDDPCQPIIYKLRWDSSLRFH